MTNYLKKPELYLKHFAFVLMALGVFDTVMFYFAFKNHFSYSGGSIFYIITGILLIKKNIKVYLKARNSVLIILALIAGAVISNTYLRIQVLLSTSGIFSKDVFSYNYLYYVIFLLAAMILTILLWKKETIIYFDEHPEHEINGIYCQ